MNAISTDINLRKVVVFDGRRIRRIDTRFVDALSLKTYAENLQKTPRSGGTAIGFLIA